MKNIITIVSLCFALCIFNPLNPFLLRLAHASSITRIFYVATNGNDAWSGTIPTQNVGGTDGPFATITKARDAVRALKRAGSLDSFNVLVRGGTYYFTEILILGTADSGTVGKPFVIKAYENERPVLSGSKKVDNFVPYQGSIYQADLTSIIAGSYSFSQLFAAGKRQIVARYPNYDPLNPIGGGFLYADSPATAGSTTAFLYQVGSVPNWTSLPSAKVVMYPGRNYTKLTRSISGINHSTRTITLSTGIGYGILPHNRYYFQNTLELLDSPGEWYFDAATRKLYFYPPDQAALESVFIPVIPSIVSITGNDIHLQGFTIEGGERNGVYVGEANRVVVAKNTIRNVAEIGVYIYNGTGNTATGNDIYEVGGEGIYISGGNKVTLTPANHRADNNYIHNVGIGPSTKSGIACTGVGSVVSHNRIHSVPRVGIWLEGNDHLFEFNHVHHVNQETQDSGIIYFGQVSWVKRGNVIRFNYLHDSGGYGRNKTTGQWVSPIETYGVYLDDWTSGTHVYGNIVANINAGAVLIHSGRDNIIENNIIIEGGARQMIYSEWPPNHSNSLYWLPIMFDEIQARGYTKYPLISTITDIAIGAKMSGNSFVKNIIYSVNPSSILYGVYNGIDLATTVSNYNTIYQGGVSPLTQYLSWTVTQPWSTWQGRGMDLHSVIADPLFTNIARGDFTLSPNSPALRMGFQPIPFSSIGLYNDPLRASWPVGTIAPAIPNALRLNN